MRPWLHKDHFPGSCSQKGGYLCLGTTVHVGHFLLCDPRQSLHPSQPASSLTAKLGLAWCHSWDPLQCPGQCGAQLLSCLACLSHADLFRTDPTWHPPEGCRPALWRLLTSHGATSASSSDLRRFSVDIWMPRWKVMWWAE